MHDGSAMGAGWKNGSEIMGDPPPDVMNASHQVFVLAFDLVDAEVVELPGQVAAALTSAPVQDAIKKTLIDFAKSKAKTGDTVVSGDEAKKLSESLQKGVTDAASKEVLDKIKGTPEYKKLQASIEAFQKAATSSALGVWIDKNQNILYVVGAALIVGTASVLYITKTGGSVVSTAVDPLKGKAFEVLQIGKLHIKASLWDFQPDARILGARVISSADWGRVKLDLKLGVLAEGPKVQQVEGEAVVKSGPVSFNFNANAKPQTQIVNLGLKVDYQSGKINLGLGAMYQDNLMSGTASLGYKTKDATFGLQGNVGERKEGGVQYGALFTVTIPIH